MGEDDPAPAPVPVAWVAPRWRIGILVILGVLFLAIGLHQASRDAPTVDEGVDVSSGVTSLVRHDLRLVPEHPALPKAMAALPALLTHPKVPDTAAYRSGNWFDYSDDFISANEVAGRLRPMLTWARAVVLVEALGCAVLLYRLGRRFFAPDGGALAAAAWLTTPYIVGFGHFAMIDVPFTLAVLATSVVLAWWRDGPSLRRAVGVGLVLGAALASRHTALVLVLIAVVVMVSALRRVPRDAVIQVLLAGVTSVAVVWIVYRGLAPSGPSGPVAARFDGIVGTAADGSVMTRLVTSLPLPAEWRAGFAYLDLTSVARPSSLLGQSWDGGRWWYFPVSALLKLPLTLVAAIVAGWAVATRRWWFARLGRDRPAVAPDPDRSIPGSASRLGPGIGMVVVLPAVALWLFLVAQPLNLGLRLALPTVALAYVGLGALVPRRGRRLPVPAGQTRFRTPSRPLIAVALGALAVGQVASLAASVPFSLAWTPPPWRPAYRWVSDANLDAGQAAYQLRAWARTHDRPYVAYDATRGFSIGGGVRPLIGVDPRSIRGWVALGVTPLMQTRKSKLAWLRAYCPVDTLAGGAVLVYRFRSAPDVRPGPQRPVGPCLGASTSTRR